MSAKALALGAVSAVSAIGALVTAGITHAAVYTPVAADITTLGGVATDTTNSVISTFSQYAVVLIPLVVLGFVVRWVFTKFA
jgi:hypothetical protein